MITIDADPRMQQGAYITDGIDLYEVTGSLRGPGVMGISTVRLRVENCQSMESLELLPDKVRGQFKLVREAPSGICPDVVEQISWGLGTAGSAPSITAIRQESESRAPEADPHRGQPSHH
jgi:hypothetical protein